MRIATPVFQAVFMFSFLFYGSAMSQTAKTEYTPTPRMRVITDNDYKGDPDGLFQLAHLLLSPSVEVRAVIGSHLKPGEPWDPSNKQGENAAAKARELMQAMGLKTSVPVLAGSNTPLLNDSTPVKSAGVDFIIREAMRTDTTLPLYVLCGGSLTEIASALLTEPKIAGRLTVIWIGGPEHTGLALPPPGNPSPEYNVNLDIASVRAVFNRTNVPLWQIPRNVYRQAMISYSQLLTRVKIYPKGGTYLASALESTMSMIQPYVNIGETYILGDSPLVLLTALQSSFEADPSSSDYVLKMAPSVSAAGAYEFNPTGRTIRVYNRIDTYLMFEDFFAKLALLNK
jgi:purine nucleosidase